MNFWDKNTENNFFVEAMKNFASPEQLFYKLTDGYFAYVPKGKGAEGQTLQSRNSLIGQYTEKWCKDFFQPIADELGLFAVNSVICPKLGLTTQSDADLAFCTTNETLQKKAEKETKKDTISKEEFMEWTKSIWTFNAESARRVGHPAPFPIDLPYRLIQLYSFTTDIILDPFIGSGTTAIAALKSNRDYVGFEISKEYIDLTQKRIAPFENMLKLD